MPTNNPGSSDYDTKKGASQSEGSRTSALPRSKSPIEEADRISRPGTPSTVHSLESSPDTPQNDASGTRDLRVEPSRASTVLPPPIYIPRRQRRGLLSHFTIIPEVANPYSYPRRTKWTITACIALSAAAAPMGSAIIMPALLPIAHDLHSTPTTTNLSVALYMLSMSIFPLWWSSFSEQLGRRSVLIFSFFLFTVFALLSAVSPNIAMLIVMRVLSGGAAASVQAVGAGGISDMWEPKDRGQAMGIFYLGPLCGPLLAPIFGGAMAEKLGWRSTQWFLCGYGAFTTLCLTLGLPETLPRKRNLTLQLPEDNPQSGDGRTRSHQENEKQDEEKGVRRGVMSEGVEPVQTIPTTNSESLAEPPDHALIQVSTRQSVQLKTKRIIQFFRRSIIDPLSIILLLRFPPVALTVYYASITFGSLYFLNISISSSFAIAPYHFTTLVIGLLYIPNSVGYMVASIFGGRWLDHVMHREARRKGRYDARGKLLLSPIDRMQENAWISAILFPGALLWYGWTVQKGVHWIVPMIANFFFGVGSMIVFAMSATMLTEFLPGRASNGVAVNNFVRNIFSCVGAIIAEPLIRAIGNGWLCTILAIVAIVSGAVVILVMKKYGEGWREKMLKELEPANEED